MLVADKNMFYVEKLITYSVLKVTHLILLLLLLLKEVGNARLGESD